MDKQRRENALTLFMSYNPQQAARFRSMKLAAIARAEAKLKPRSAFERWAAEAVAAVMEGADE